MKKGNIILMFLIAVIVLSIAAGYLAGYLVYKEYKLRTSEFERQVELKYSKLETNLKDFYVRLENTVDENRADRKKFLEHIEKMKNDLKGWESSYREALSELENNIEDLKVDRLNAMVEKLENEVHQFKMSLQDMDLKMDEVRGIAADTKKLREQDLGIDLGTISVGRDSKKKQDKK